MSSNSLGSRAVALLCQHQTDGLSEDCDGSLTFEVLQQIIQASWRKLHAAQGTVPPTERESARTAFISSAVLLAVCHAHGTDPRQFRCPKDVASNPAAAPSQATSGATALLTSRSVPASLLDLSIIIGEPDSEPVLLARAAKQHLLQCESRGHIPDDCRRVSSWCWRTSILPEAGQPEAFDARTPSLAATALDSIQQRIGISTLEFQRSFMQHTALWPACRTTDVQPDITRAAAGSLAPSCVTSPDRIERDAHSVLVECRGLPVVLEGIASHWPAFEKWTVPSFWLDSPWAQAWVPVETGSEGYAAPTSQEVLVQLSAFMREHVFQQQASDDEQHDGRVKRARVCNPVEGSLHVDHESTASVVTEDFGIPLKGADTILTIQPVGSTAQASFAAAPPPVSCLPGAFPLSALDRPYLAQHTLFEHISQLRADIAVPDYCCLAPSTAGNDALSSDESVRVNAWIGPPGTVSNTHQDPPHNILVQIQGRKRIKLYAPVIQGCSMYPGKPPFGNTSLVNPELDALDLRTLWPLFPPQPTMEVILQPGQALYIPPLWWHHIRALDSSISVSFWWD